MSIIHVRIDDRLVHGQVAMIWTNVLSATRIMVVDDEASKSDIKKMSLKLATPNGVSLSVLTIEAASKRIHDGVYEGQRVLLVIKSPENLLKLIKFGVDITGANLGNLTARDGVHHFSNTIIMNDDQVNVCKQLRKLDVKLTMQLLPSDDDSEVII